MIQETVERSFFEALRLNLVADGYTPDITNTTLFPDTPAGYDAYEAALGTIAAGVKGFSVEVFGSANPQSRGTKKLPRITCQTSAFLPGSVGYDSSNQIQWNPEIDKFEIYNYDGRSYDLMIDCTVSTESQHQLRILMDIVHRSIPSMGYLKYYNSEELFNTELSAFQKYIKPGDGVLEYTYRYEVPDIQWVDPIKKVGTTISPIKEITLNLQIMDRLGISKVIT